MADEPRDTAPPQDPPYRVYSAGSAGPRTRAEASRGTERPALRGSDRPYKVYRSGPRSLRSRLRGEQDLARPGSGRPGGRRSSSARGLPWWRRQLRPLRLLAGLVGLILAWLLLSLVLFVISAQEQSGSIPASAKAALSSGGNMLTSTDTVLVLGTDQRPKGTHEAGANTSDKGSRSDTIMLWRIGGGTSRRLSIPRDTLTTIPGYGEQKINAGYAFGGPALAIKTIERFTGITINHIIVVNLANFPKFIDDVGGINIKTGRICSNISGGVKNGGFTLNLRPGVHHLTGIEALTLARTRDNACDPASNDLTREGYQQQILNSIKSQLLTPTTLFHLPWAAWDAPKAVRSDMGGFTLFTLFAAAEMGGSAPTKILNPTGAQDVPGVGDSLLASPDAVRRAVNQLMNG